MGKRKKFRQSPVHVEDNQPPLTKRLTPKFLIGKYGFDEDGYIIPVQQELVPLNLENPSARESTADFDPIAKLPKPPPAFDPIHLATATKQLTKPKPEGKVELSWSYTREAPPSFAAPTGADPIVDCPHCTRQLPRSRLEHHIKHAHAVDPIVKCPYCNLQGRRSQLANHIEYDHPKLPADPIVPCRYCTDQVRQSNRQNI